VLNHAALLEEVGRDEAAIRERASALKLSTELSAAQVSCTRSGAATGCWPAMTRSRRQRCWPLPRRAPIRWSGAAVDPGRRDALAAYRAGVVRFLAQDDVPPPRELSRLLRLLSPSLRLALHSQLAFLGYQQLCADYPRMLLALEAMVATLAAIGPAAPTSETTARCLARAAACCGCSLTSTMSRGSPRPTSPATRW